MNGMDPFWSGTISTWFNLPPSLFTILIIPRIQLLPQSKSHLDHLSLQSSHSPFPATCCTSNWAVQIIAPHFTAYLFYIFACLPNPTFYFLLTHLGAGLRYLFSIVKALASYSTLLLNFKNKLVASNLFQFYLWNDSWIHSFFFIPITDGIVWNFSSSCSAAIAS